MSVILDYDKKLGRPRQLKRPHKKLFNGTKPLLKQKIEMSTKTNIVRKKCREIYKTLKKDISDCS